jgi:hypothetical protein
LVPPHDLTATEGKTSPGQDVATHGRREGIKALPDLERHECLRGLAGVKTKRKSTGWKLDYLVKRLQIK